MYSAKEQSVFALKCKQELCAWVMKLIYEKVTIHMVQEESLNNL